MFVLCMHGLASASAVLLPPLACRSIASLRRGRPAGSRADSPIFDADPGAGLVAMASSSRVLKALLDRGWRPDALRFALEPAPRPGGVEDGRVAARRLGVASVAVLRV